jgi:serine/threonine protein kinase/Tol biopolymer transport system component
MSLSSGQSLGPYTIQAPLGAGGMGEVYRARDARLNRDVAIKVVPPSVADNPEALARFERESHAIAALSHPNILTIFDVGHSDGRPFAVMELLEGETLRARIAGGPLPVRKAVEIAGQIARGLAAAHDKQIAHRDLKPDNVFVTPTGGVKILDFGLARDTAAHGQLTRVESPTMAPATTPGTVLGTVGYMAPEQVRGEPADHRSDLFALGCVLYEMLTGERAYKRETAAETMSAILREDPPDPSTLNVTVPPGVQRALRRCLEKRPQERFESARDLAFALESAVDDSSASASAPSAPRRDRRWLLAGVAAVALGAIVGFASARAISRPSAASGPQLAAQFRQLTFDKGTIRDGRFTPDGQSIIYGAAWNGQPLKLFMVRTDSPESAPLSLPDARLLSVSKAGELAISLNHTFEGWMGEGTLARSSLLGSAPRVVAEHVREADWSPDGGDLAVVRRADGFERLEFPLGTVLYQTSGYISDIRFSPSGDRIAFADHPIYSDDAGTIAVVDRAGHRSALSDGWTSIHGLAWSKDGSEIWFGATKGVAVNPDGVFAVTSSGRLRAVTAGPTRYKVLDIAADGRVLIGRDRDDRVVEAQLAGGATPADLTIRDASMATWVANDGSRALIADLSTAPYQTYLLKVGGSPVRLGTGQPTALSPDGRWALAVPVDGHPLFLHPTGPGASRALPDPENIVFNIGGWLDANRIIVFGQKMGERSQGYIQDINSGPPRRFTPEGAEVNAPTWWTLPISPDGTRVVVADDHGEAKIYPVAGGEPTPVPHLNPGDVVVQWSADASALLVAHRDGLPWIVERLDLVSGRRTQAATIRAHDAAGLRLSVFGISRDAKYYVHTYARLLSDLFVVDGLR